MLTTKVTKREEEEHEVRKDGSGRNQFDHLSNRVLGCAIEVHRFLGPGLMESTYERCLSHELRLEGIHCESQVSLPIEYKGMRLDSGLRIDLLVENRMVLELKSVETLSTIHEAQILTYMRLGKIPIGLLVNFNVTLLKNGIRRFVL